MKGTRLILLAAVLPLASCKRETPTPPPATQPTTTTAPATRPTTTTAPATAPAVLRELKDLYTLHDPKLGEAKRLLETLPLWEAMHLQFDEPVHLDTRGDLWITHEKAEPLAGTLATASKQQTHVVPVKVLLAHWFNDAQGQTKVRLVTPGEAADTFNLTDQSQTKLLAIAGADFAHARMWNDLIIVPDTSGYTVIRGDGSLAAMPLRSGDAEVAFVFDSKGILAWSTPRGSIGPTRVMRFAENTVEDLTAAHAWPAGIVQLVPLTDGNMLTIARTPSGLDVSQVLMAEAVVDSPAIEALVKQLSDRDPAKRQEATEALAGYGSTAWPVLEKLATKQPPEARLRIETLLGDRKAPTLAGMRPLPGNAVVAARLENGVVVYFDNGVEHVDGGGQRTSVVPAWIAIEPGFGFTLLSPSLVGDLLASKVKLAHIGEDWIVQATPDGPMRWMGNHFRRIAGKDEADFKTLFGIDSRGRWVLKSDDGKTLLIDTRLPDSKPRLPTWNLELEPGTVTGWDAKDQPCIKRGGGGWSLGKTGWEAGQGEPVIKLAEGPTTQIGTSGETTYSGGLETLTITSSNGVANTLPLPPDAIGRGIDGKAYIVKHGEHLFLMNESARIVRLKLEHDMLKEDGTFTRGVPTGPIRRMWLDPQERIVIASGTNDLTICFPTGRMSDDMENMVPAEQLKEMQQ